MAELENIGGIPEEMGLNLCVEDNVYYYINDIETVQSTCVEKGEYWELCKSAEHVCPGFMSGFNTKGLPDQQIGFLKVALEASSHTHPQCPNCIADIYEDCIFYGCPVICIEENGFCSCESFGLTCKVREPEWLFELNTHHYDDFLARGMSMSELGRLKLLDYKEFVFQYDFNTYIPTCVKWSLSFDMECDQSEGLFCGGDTIVGSYGQQYDALQTALSSKLQVHPQCPTGCQALNTYQTEFYRQRIRIRMT
eukprot:UN24036